MPYVHWLRQGVSLTPESEVPIGKNTLVLTDVRLSQTYTCMASSSLGTHRYKVRVTVKGKDMHYTFNYTVFPDLAKTL